MTKSGTQIFSFKENPTFHTHQPRPASSCIRQSLQLSTTPGNRMRLKGLDSEPKYSDILFGEFLREREH